MNSSTSPTVVSNGNIHHLPPARDSPVGAKAPNNLRLQSVNPLFMHPVKNVEDDGICAGAVGGGKSIGESSCSITEVLYGLSRLKIEINQVWFPVVSFVNLFKLVQYSHYSEWKLFAKYLQFGIAQNETRSQRLCACLCLNVNICLIFLLNSHQSFL